MSISSGNSDSKNSKREAKTLLGGIFDVLQGMVSQTMKSNSNLKDSKELLTAQQDLQRLKSQFTSDQSPVLDEVTEQVDSYKDRIQQLLRNKPQPSVPLNLNSVLERRKNKK